MRYLAWLEASGVLVPNDSETLVIAAPGENLLVQLNHARRAGVKRIISAVLPDEIDGPARAWWDYRLEYFAAHLEFRPFRFDLPPSPPATGPAVLCVAERGAGGSMVETLARNLAEAIHGSFAHLVIEDATPAQVAAAMAEATVVINDVMDWSLGFAIDEYAARSGRRVVRLRQPGYSPLRYALLGQELGQANPPEVPRLRPKLAGVFGPAPCVPTTEIATWFSGEAAVERWRRWFHPRTVRAYWAGVNWADVSPGPSDDPGNWLNRPAAWAAVATVAEDESCPREAFAGAVTIFTQWMTASRRWAPIGWVGERGAARWVARNPEWIATYRSIGGEGRDTRDALTRWLNHGLAFAPVGAQLFEVFSAARWAWENSPLLRGGFALVHAWFQRWSDVPGVMSNDPDLTPDLRAAAAEACWSRIGEQTFPAADEAAVCDDESVWNASFGAAAPLLRALAAARCRRWQPAVTAWRNLVSACGLNEGGGLSRWARISFPNAGDLLPVIRQMARQDPDEHSALVPEAFDQWVRRRRWDLWRWPRAPLVEREIAGVSSRVPPRQIEENVHWKADHWRTLAIVNALADRPAGIAPALARIAPENPRATWGALIAATALGLREHRTEARALASRWPETAGERPLLLFARAVVAQLTDVAAASSCLARLRAAAPEFFTETKADDFRWPVVAALYLRAGLVAEGAQLRTLAAAATPGCEGFIDDQPVGGEVLAPGWREAVGV